LYIPRHFEQPSVVLMQECMAANPLATLVTLTPDGLCADHIPMRLRPELHPYGTLTGHVARANPVWHLADGREVLVIFRGPDAYITPSWYASKSTSGKVVPTWNYTAVHAYGTLRAIQDVEWLKTHVTELTDHHEASFANPWSVSDAPTDFTEKLLHGIVGIEIAISRLQGKWKLSQNRPDEDRAGVVAGLRALGADAMAELVANRSDE
jgi:transcriptional regulator